jgi:valyl-tRNA synthetase
METGFDILAPWVSRMIMLGLYVTRKVPFKTVYLHGLILDEHGIKMSKSKGNVINPMEFIDQYGSDALRMGIITGQTPGSNQPFGTAKVVGARNFCNKLWNIARFIEGKVGENYQPTPPQPETPADHWVLKVLQHSTEKLTAFLEDYRFAESYELLYHTIWDDVADWYIEASKSQKNSDMLAYVLETILKLAHPFAPFVTETIWQKLGWRENTILAIESWPQPIHGSATKAATFDAIKDVVSELRILKQKLKLTNPSVTTKGNNILTEHRDIICQLARINSISTISHPAGVRMLSAQGWLEVDAKKIDTYVAETNINKTHLQKQIEGYKKRLSNGSYVANAPAHVVQETRDQLATAEAEFSLVQAEIDRFN